MTPEIQDLVNINSVTNGTASGLPDGVATSQGSIKDVSLWTSWVLSNADLMNK